jgi:sterol desaturase/sphingolipid hydroxylase (fatty acid hydroxylase superfamily)
MGRIVERLLYPFVLAASLLLAMALIDAGRSPGLVVASCSLLFALICWACERAFPETPRWRLDPAEARADVLHAVLSNPIPTAIHRALFFGAIAALSDAIASRVGFGLWPLGWSRLAQLALALLVAEAASYAIHRFLHESRLWPLHAVHHCSPRMYFLLAVRKHPIQAFVSYGGRLSVLWLLGVPADVLTLLLSLTAAHSFVQHANVRVRTGILGTVFATPELHRLHHSRRPEELGTNYGDVLIVWDALFGTRRAPAPRSAGPPAVGLPGVEVAQTWWTHLCLPFSGVLKTEEPERCERPPPVAF